MNTNSYFPAFLRLCEASTIYYIDRLKPDRNIDDRTLNKNENINKSVAKEKIYQTVG